MARTLLIAHRGASRQAPENTLAAFRQAWQEAADGIEADFRLTRDRRVVCIHDATTGRTAGADLAVADTPLAALRRLDMGAWKGNCWAGETLPTLEEVLGLLPVGKMFFLEMKSGPEIIDPLAEILASSAVPAEQVRLLAFDGSLLALAKARLPEVRTCLNVSCRFSLRRRRWSPSREEILAELESCGADGLSSCAHPLVDAGFIAQLRRRGKEVHVWTVDSARVAGHYLDLGVDSIMTNRPGWLRSRAALSAGESL